MPLSPELDDVFETIQNPLDRDQYDRPRLIPGPELDAAPMLVNRRTKKYPDGRRPDGKLPYTRASSLANYVSDHTALETWRMRSLTKGLGEREDLAAMAAALPPIISNLRDKETLSRAEEDQDRKTNHALDAIAEEAMIYANRDYKANWGTAVHGFTDPGPHGDVPERMRADVDSWFAATAGWEILATEVFVRNDTYQAAGSFDHLVRIPWRPDLGVLVVDKKTGLLHPDQFSVQLAVYAGGVPYDPHTDTTYDWPGGEAPNRDVALLAHIPLGRGITPIYTVDIAAGAAAAEHAVAVRAHRQNKSLMTPVDFLQELRIHLGGVLTTLTTREEMLALAEEYAFAWHDDLSAIAKQRLADLGERHLASA